MPDISPHITVNKDDVHSFVIDSILLENVRTEKLVFAAHWNASMKNGGDKFHQACEIARKIGTPRFVGTHGNYADGLVLRDQSVVKLWIGKKLDVEVWAKTQEDATKEVQAIRKIVEPYLITPENESGISVTFWNSNTKGDVKQNERIIACPSWQEIRENYGSSVQPDIESLVAMKKPWEAGKIIFWSGPPGSGKTFGIRSLIREWHGVVEPNYIMDPETFFSDAQYMSEAVMTTSNKFDEDGDSKPSTAGKLFIIEDMPDLILTKTRLTRCAEMARLLNLSDGFIGQGFNAIFLLTTNEDVHDVDPAFLRDGRILQQTAFTKFNMSAAKAWLGNRGIAADRADAAICGEMTLAELYAVLRGKRPKSHVKDRKVGFAVEKSS